MKASLNTGIRHLQNTSDTIINGCLFYIWHQWDADCHQNFWPTPTFFQCFFKVSVTFVGNTLSIQTIQMDKFEWTNSNELIQMNWFKRIDLTKLIQTDKCNGLIQMDQFERADSNGLIQWEFSWISSLTLRSKGPARKGNPHLRDIDLSPNKIFL